MAHSTYGTLNQFIYRDNAIRGDGGSGLLRVLYILNAFTTMICGVILIKEFEIRSLLLGLNLVATSVIIIGLEFAQPLEVIKWIVFYETNLGRGILLIFLSSAAMFGSFLLGFISLLISTATIVLHFWGFDVPLPLFESRVPLGSLSSDII